MAISVLGWLAGEPELLGRFLALTGIQPDQLRHAAADPGFLAGLLDFLMEHEPTLMAFCAATDSKPEDVAAAAHTYSRPHLDSGEY
ncbi:Protein of unknown function [Rhizobium sp. RU36D]|nr:Protein of unknown function [Rhizobium sp. RU36D]